MHPLLRRQLRRALGADFVVPEALAPLFATIADTYAQHDADRALLEHSLHTVSDELLERHRRLGLQKEQAQALEAERRRSAELTLLSAVSSLALRHADPDAALAELVALVPPAVDGVAAELWREDEAGWRCVASWPPSPTSRLWSEFGSLDAAREGLAARSRAREIGVIPIHGAALRPKVLLVASTPEAGLSLMPALATAIAQQASAVLEHLRTARALHENAELLAGITRASGNPVFALDLDGRYVMINPAGAELFGRAEAEILGATDAALLGPEQGALSRAEDAHVRETGLPHSTERAFGTEPRRDLLVRKAPLRNPHGEIVGIVGVATDLTDRKVLEAQLLQAHKMEALGRLAGGIAHDFNNLLTVIIGNLEILTDDAIVPESEQEWVRSALEAAGRARDLTARLLAFGRRSIAQSAVFDLGVTVDAALPALRRAAGAKVTLVMEPGEGAMMLRADAAQLERALVELVTNAREAMPEGGTVTLTTQPIVLAEIDARELDLEPGPYVRITVEDTGPGIDDAVRARVFEPFFTTRTAGRSAGLGLTMVYAFVRGCGGHIEVRSYSGEGTIFDLYLPLVGPVMRQVLSDRPPEPRGAPAGATILLAEDESALRHLAERILVGGGYRVLAARNGVDALARARSWGGPIDLLLSDVVMPEMGGGELWRTLTKERPGLPVVFMSGYTDDEIVRAGILRQDFGFLPKPFGQRALLEAVGDALAARGTQKAS
jgi:two-component system cell cycle sensor histidine kinase/response regulator CckA